jgi:hypothetical protein
MRDGTPNAGRTLPAGRGVTRKSLNKSFDKLRTNGKCLIPLVVSLSNHERNQLVQGFLEYIKLSAIWGDWHVTVRRK